MNAVLERAKRGANWAGILAWALAGLTGAGLEVPSVHDYAPWLLLVAGIVGLLGELWGPQS